MSDFQTAENKRCESCGLKLLDSQAKDSRIAELEDLVKRMAESLKSLSELHCHGKADFAKSLLAELEGKNGLLSYLRSE